MIHTAVQVAITITVACILYLQASVKLTSKLGNLH